MKNFNMSLDYDKNEIVLRPSQKSGQIDDNRANRGKAKAAKPMGLSILDDILGNKFSHQSRLFDLRLDNSTYDLLSKGISTKPFYAEVSMDMFAGVLAGNFPYYSTEVYRANVNDIKLQVSLNLTTNIKFQIFNLIKIDLEIDFVPLLVGIGGSGYTSSLLEDNCSWVYWEMNLMALTTKLRKNVATCGGNVRNVVGEMESWD